MISEMLWFSAFCEPQPQFCPIAVSQNLPLSTMGNSISTCFNANLGRVRKRHSIQPATGISEAMAEFMPNEKQTPPYFWGEEWNQERRFKQHAKHCGYEEARILIGHGSQGDIERNISKGLRAVSTAYRLLDDDKCDAESKQGCPDSDISYQQRLESLNIVGLCFSDDLAAWRREHHVLGRISSDSHRGRRRASNEVIQLLGAEDWPAPLLTTDVLFGAGLMNVRTLLLLSWILVFHVWNIPECITLGSVISQLVTNTY